MNLKDLIRKKQKWNWLDRIVDMSSNSIWFHNTSNNKNTFKSQKVL